MLQLVMKCTLWLVVMVIMLYRSLCQEDNCTNGDLRVTGLNTTDLIAGHIKLCIGVEWRAVCHGGWDVADAMVVCRQLGFPAEGATHCTSSCFGRTTELMGIYNINCTGNEMNLTECHDKIDNEGCGGDAGVICINNMTTVTPETTTAGTSPITTMGEGEGGTNGVTVGLGILSAVLAILLVGVLVVLGWVWFYYRVREKKSVIHERSNPGQIDPTNNSYSGTSPHLYSSLIHRDMPHNHTTPSSGVANKGPTPILPEGGGDGIYHVLEAPGQGEEGGVANYEGLDKEGGGIYHMLGEEGHEVEEKTYEVPVSGIPQAPTVLGMEYSTLQHH